MLNAHVWIHASANEEHSAGFIIYIVIKDNYLTFALCVPYSFQIRLEKNSLRCSVMIGRWLATFFFSKLIDNSENIRKMGNLANFLRFIIGGIFFRIGKPYIIIFCRYPEFSENPRKYCVVISRLGKFFHFQKANEICHYMHGLSDCPFFELSIPLKKNRLLTSNHLLLGKRAALNVPCWQINHLQLQHGWLDPTVTGAL